MAEFEIAPLGGGRFRIKVAEGATSTTHEVTVPVGTIERLAWKGTPEELIRRSFEFLLEREPKESILSRFDIDVIGRYFPQWEETARRGF